MVASSLTSHVHYKIFKKLPTGIAEKNAAELYLHCDPWDLKFIPEQSATTFLVKYFVNTFPSLLSVHNVISLSRH